MIPEMNQREIRSCYYGGYGQNASHRGAHKGMMGSIGSADNPSSGRVRCAYLNASDGKILAAFAPK